nr:hypothetical protein GCM10020092_074730 [Actinoplanes digitatis]
MSAVTTAAVIARAGSERRPAGPSDAGGGAAPACGEAAAVTTEGWCGGAVIPSRSFAPSCPSLLSLRRIARCSPDIAGPGSMPSSSAS